MFFIINNYFVISNGLCRTFYFFFDLIYGFRNTECIKSTYNIGLIDISIGNFLITRGIFILFDFLLIRGFLTVSLVPLYFIVCCIKNNLKEY